MSRVLWKLREKEMAIALQFDASWFFFFFFF